MKKIILSLIIAVAAALTVSADGITIKQLHEAGRKAAIEASAAIKRGERIEAPRFHHPKLKQLRKAGEKAAIKTTVAPENAETKGSAVIIIIIKEQ